MNMIEPTTFVSGVTVMWNRFLPDYPANEGWTLRYSYRGAASIDITAVADGANYNIIIDKVASSAFLSGDYYWAAFVTDGINRYQVADGRLTVIADLATTTVFDGRTQAERILSTLKNNYERYVNTGKMSKSIGIGDKQITYKDDAELIALIDRWSSIVRSEQRAARVAKGLKSGSKILVRF